MQLQTGLWSRSRSRSLLQEEILEFGAGANYFKKVDLELKLEPPILKRLELESDILKSLDPVKLHQLKFLLCILCIVLKKNSKISIIKIKCYLLKLLSLVYLDNKKYITVIDCLNWLKFYLPGRYEMMFINWVKFGYSMPLEIGN